MYSNQNALYLLVVVMAHVVASPPDQARTTISKKFIFLYPCGVPNGRQQGL